MPWLALGLSASPAAVAQTPRDSPPADARELADLSLEQLGSIVVTSVSRRDERLGDAPASVFVITAEDIRRIGATTLPQALRLAPNLDVAQVDAARFAISARGFNQPLANKLLVLVDGRTVYSPLFSGTFWESQDVPLEDVERIEVISGPGASLWGANAVNGVINVITRSARDTLGTRAGLVVGDRERGVSARWGGTLGADGAIRFHVRSQEFDPTSTSDGRMAPDGARRWQAGFRADWGTAASGLMLQGNVQDFDGGLAPAQGRTLRGGNLLARWTRQLDGGGSLRLQGYVDRIELRQPGNIGEDLTTFDVEFQHALPRTGRHRLLWGGGYRHSDSRVLNGGPALFILPADRDLRWIQAFVQDEITLRPDLTLTLGGKLENNVYTGTEFLPNLRLAWRPAPDRLWWAALSRAVRAPSRFDREFAVPAFAPVPFLGGPAFVSEASNVLELGWRAQLSPALNVSATLFHHDLRRQRSVEQVPGGLAFGNGLEGTTTGLESWATWQATPRWRLSGGLVAMDMRLRTRPGSTDATRQGSLANDPDHWLTLRSSLDITPRHQFDVFVRQVGALPAPRLAARTAVDARLGWRISRELDIALVGRNLLERRQVEWPAPGLQSEIPRSVFLQLQWRP